MFCIKRIWNSLVEAPIFPLVMSIIFYLGCVLAADMTNRRGAVVVAAILASWIAVVIGFTEFQSKWQRAQ
jgi:hypothetical protein